MAHRQNAFQLAMLLLPAFVNQAEKAHPEPKSGLLKNEYVRTTIATVLQMVGAAAELNNPALAGTISTIIDTTVAFNKAEASTMEAPATTPFPTPVPAPAAAPTPVPFAFAPAIAPAVPNLFTAPAPATNP